MIESARNYNAQTYGSSSLTRRFSHNTRLEIALALAETLPNSRVLDYGGGDGIFLNRLLTRVSDNTQVINYEPYMEGAQDGRIRRVRTWGEVEAAAAEAPFDLVSCQEVMEHFSEPRQRAALGHIASILAPSGTLMISVPIESGPVAIVKNVERWKKYRSRNPELFNAGNLIRSALRLPIPIARSGDGHLSHMGFYHQDFERVLRERFRIVSRRFSPFQRLPAMANSQVFYLCRLAGAQPAPEPASA